MIFAVNSKCFSSKHFFRGKLILFVLQKFYLYEKLFKLHLALIIVLVFFFWQTSPIQPEFGKEEKIGSKTKETEM